jgi:hypothetical protein
VIVFDLRCGGGHVFEAWFASSGAYEEQVSSAQVHCPFCGDASVEKAVMAPAVAAKSNRRVQAGQGRDPSVPRDQPTPAMVKAALQALAAAQAKALESSQWVGSSFADQARAMHEGERDKAPIHGQASLAEAKALVEEGVPVAPLLLPVVPPKTLN